MVHFSTSAGKKKPFNKLDERFQVKDGDDPNIIFPDELKMVAVLRKRIPELKTFSDKMLVWFLCARRHDIEQTVGVLQKYLAKRHEFGFDVSPPQMNDIAWSVKNMTLHLQGSVDKHDRMLFYYWIGNDHPKGRTLRQMFAYAFWETEYLCKTETLKVLRNGSVTILDMKNFHMSNIDFSSNGKQFHDALSGAFPKRMREIAVANPTLLFKVALAAAKTVLPKKISKRINSYSGDQVRALIPPQNLLREYGGQCSACIAEYAPIIEKNDPTVLKNEPAAGHGHGHAPRILTSSAGTTIKIGS